MKIEKIILKNYINYKKDLNISFKYPVGHIKEGKILEKICFIGDNNTGKTNLLKLINSLIKDVIYSSYYYNSNINKLNNEDSFTIDFNLNDDTFIADKELNNSYINYNNRNNVQKYIQNLPSDFGLNINFDLNKKDDGIINIYNFNNDNVIKDVYKYNKDYLKYNSELFNLKKKVANDVINNNYNNLNKLKEEYNKFKLENEDLLIKLEEILNPILNKVGIKIKNNFDENNILDIGHIHLEDILGNFIPLYNWSSGLNKLMSILLPLYFLKPTNSIILIDNIENNLDKNIQNDIFDACLKLITNSQFIITSHSNNIISKFEPCEIFLCYIDNGKINIKPSY